VSEKRWFHKNWSSTMRFTMIESIYLTCQTLKYLSTIRNVANYFTDLLTTENAANICSSNSIRWSFIINLSVVPFQKPFPSSWNQVQCSPLALFQTFILVFLKTG
jgi:hypothetical protein